MGDMSKSIKDLDDRINKTLRSFVNSKYTLLKQDDLRNMVNFLFDVLNECLAQKKFNLVGCKMKVYQERMKQIK